MLLHNISLLHYLNSLYYKTFVFSKISPVCLIAVSHPVVNSVVRIFLPKTKDLQDKRFKD